MSENENRKEFHKNVIMNTNDVEKAKLNALIEIAWQLDKLNKRFK